MSPARKSAFSTASTASGTGRSDARALARDEAMMRQALRMAARGDGRVYPNPSVGAVVFRGDRILGRGTTCAQSKGGAHAEVQAIRATLRKHGERALRGAQIAVTLEPCSFKGRTGACTEALLAAGITRVVAGCRDPHAKVSGRGFQKLRRAGVEVRTGVLEAECREKHRGFISVCERGHPFVTLKLAATLDGRIATASGESRWITGPESRAFVHRLRDQHDAVLVGSETALADDPELSVRRGEKRIRMPIRVLLDGRLRVPMDSKLYAVSPTAPTIVICRERARGLARVRETGAQLIEVPRGDKNHVDLPSALAALATAGLTTLLVEGGGGLAAALIRADLVDEVHWMLAPKMVGSEGRPALGSLSLTQLADAASLTDVRVRKRGEDIHVVGRVAREEGN
ncbi:MAG: bifunctional diaminohydroxyphosphoribosylaminopyrimidine deaminase/5-amino-6-(5-phosphoribosylamino)uracil reductase RibD [Myxococcota bacterium]